MLRQFQVGVLRHDDDVDPGQQLDRLDVHHQRHSNTSYLGFQDNLAVEILPNEARWPPGIGRRHDELEYLFGDLLDDDPLVVLAEAFHADAIYHRSFAPTVLARPVASAPAEAEGSRRGRAELAATKIFHRSA